MFDVNFIDFTKQKDPEKEVQTRVQVQVQGTPNFNIKQKKHSVKETDGKQLYCHKGQRKHVFQRDVKDHLSNKVLKPQAQ